MKRLFSFLFFIIFLSSCSFDNKTGIWKDSSDLEKIKKKHTKNKELKDVFVEDKIFDEEKEASPGTKIEIDYPFKTKNWTDIYFNLENNISNIYYENSKYLVFKSSKISKSSENKDFLFYNNNIISTDNKGRIYVYSLEQKKKIFEYNFYKNKFKKYRKEIKSYCSPTAITIESVSNLIKNNQREAQFPFMSLKDSLDNMKMIDEWKKLVIEYK